MANTLVIIFGVLGAFVSVASILKYLYEIINGISAIRHSVSLSSARLQGDLDLLKSLLLSSKEDFVRQLAELEERVEKLEDFIAKYVTLRK